MLTSSPQRGRSTHNPILPIWQEIVVGASPSRCSCFVLMKFVFPRMETDVPGSGRRDRGRYQARRGGPGRGQPLLEQYSAQLAEARTEAARIRDDARADAEGIRQDILAQGA